MKPLLPTAAGGFGTLVVDPPWSFRDKGSRAAPDHAGARRGYRTLPDAEIVGLPVAEIAAPCAHLYLWTTDAHLPAALRCVDAWGFRLVQTLVWVKRGAAGRLQIGMGHYFRHAHELALFAVRGRTPTLRHDLPSVFEAPRRAHSAKPEALQDLAERMSPPPRVELFARRSRAGWALWGDQLAMGDAA